MEHLKISAHDKVLMLGATGFVGSRLIPQLVKRNVSLRFLVRNPSKVSAHFPHLEAGEVVRGDLTTGQGVSEALQGVHSAYYLVHSMGGKSIFRNMEFAEKDKQAARNFISAANSAGLKRVIYLGGLGEMRDNLSEHLKSRAEVAAFSHRELPLQLSFVQPLS